VPDAIELLGETQDKKYADAALSMLDDRSYGVIDQASLGSRSKQRPSAHMTP
jgi:hypothetical protein